MRNCESIIKIFYTDSEEKITGLNKCIGTEPSNNCPKFNEKERCADDNCLCYKLNQNYFDMLPERNVPGGRWQNVQINAIDVFGLPPKDGNWKGLITLMVDLKPKVHTFADKKPDAVFYKAKYNYNGADVTGIVVRALGCYTWHPTIGAAAKFYDIEIGEREFSWLLRAAIKIGIFQDSRAAVRLVENSDKFKIVAEIDKKKCMGIDDCMNKCEEEERKGCFDGVCGAIGWMSNNDGKAVVFDFVCDGCGKCVPFCKEYAIQMVKKASNAKTI